MAQLVRNLPAMRETQVRSLGWEDPLEKVMATHSTILAWRFPRTEEPGCLQSMGWQRVKHDWVTNTPNIKGRTEAKTDECAHDIIQLRGEHYCITKQKFSMYYLNEFAEL